ncbi:DUF2332 family protein [Chelativorans sp. Marseille-P2723]|uniref:DUF2332 domain-containing protein n=1 Tax=Chelativorans sp. Marseille-P2723 TaxID=2709133 RepID=UPI00156EF201|nr:DUF2332 family protein [Chelativorans sp. Marseille-P2723]
MVASQQEVWAHFAAHAEACERLGSPFAARICRLLPQILDNSTVSGSHILSWPGDPQDDGVVIRLMGALHAVVLSGGDAQLANAYPPYGEVSDEALLDVLSAAIRRHDVRIHQGLDSPPQTNEVARAAMLLPGFLAIGSETGMPLAIREIGSSAGLNLYFDRFHYRYGELCWGEEGSPVRLAPQLRGNAPPLGGFMEVASRRGCDIAPVDINDEGERLRLKSFIWPDQTERLARLEAAMAIARQARVTLRRADAAEFLAAELAERKKDQVFVLFHSVMWQYMPQETQRRIENLLDSAGEVPLAWLRMEPVAGNVDFATLRLTMWPAGETRDLARCDFHGRWLEWLEG